MPRYTHPIFTIGRLESGVSATEAQAAFSAVAAELAQLYRVNERRGVNVEPLTSVVFGSVRSALLTLFAAVVLVLLIACVNVANLMLARGSTRSREIAVRTALGASGTRLARQFLIENMMLALAAACLGIVIANAGLKGLLALAPSNAPRIDAVGVDSRVLLFTVSLSLLVGLSFGLVPTLQSLRTDVQTVLRRDGGGSSSSREGLRLRSGLVVLQVALAVVLFAVSKSHGPTHQHSEFPVTLRFAIVLVFAVALVPIPVQAQSTFVVRDVRVFDGERVAERRSVLVENGLISRVGGQELTVPQGTTVIDGVGRTLLPGLIDAHVHLSDDVESDLQQALSLGVTTVFDMFTGSTRFDRIKSVRAADLLNLADVRTAGVGATAPGGHPSQMGGPPLPTIADSAKAAAFVDARVAEGSDFIKIVYDDLSTLGMSVPMIDRGTLAGVIAAAHARGKLAVVHVMSEDQARTAIEAGADGLVHLFAAGNVAPDFARIVAQHGAFVIPTLTLLFGRCGESNGASIVNDSLLRPFIRPELRAMMSMNFTPRAGARSCEGTKEAVRELASRGVRILTGTDAPVPGQTYGASVHGELELLVETGLTPLQSLKAATLAPAQAFGLTDRGRIAPGFRADLVLVDGDPTTEIHATRRIVAIWKRGVPVRRVRYQD